MPTALCSYRKYSETRRRARHGMGTHSGYCISSDEGGRTNDEVILAKEMSLHCADQFGVLWSGLIRTKWLSGYKIDGIILRMINNTSYDTDLRSSVLC